MWPAGLVKIPAGAAEEKCNAFKSIVCKVSKEKLGTAVRKHKEWFDENCMELEKLIKNNNLARNNMLSNHGPDLLATNIE